VRVASKGRPDSDEPAVDDDAEAEGIDAEPLESETVKGPDHLSIASIHSIASSIPGLVVEDDRQKKDKSSIISTLDVRSSSNLRLGVKPEAKLRAVLNISKALAQVLNLGDVLQKILDGLFQIFPQADEGFVILRDPKRHKLSVKATKTRSPDGENTVRVSMTIVRHALKSGQAILSADAVGDPRFDSSQSLSGLMIRSMMCVPFVGKSGEALGVLQIDTKDIRHQFSNDDLDLLVAVGSQAGLAVENARLHASAVVDVEIRKDLEIARQIQLGFLPHQPPRLEGFEFYDRYEPALSVGGDYFDYVQLPGNRVAVAVGDVAGKGIPAALLMARLYSAARFHLLTSPSAAEALTGLNSELASSGLGHRFITCVLGIIEPEKNQVVIANAGHLPPVVRTAAGELRIPDRQESGLPLGVLPNQEFKEVAVPFLPGDSLTLYTDGISESMNAKNEIYGRERLATFIQDSKAESAEGLLDGIVTDVEKFCDGRAQRDDVCLVCVRRIPAGAEPASSGEKSTGEVKRTRSRRKEKEKEAT
jgi:serine phosphatase RsbU (regulator of sigma subunit)